MSTLDGHRTRIHDRVGVSRSMPARSRGGLELAPPRSGIEIVDAGRASSLPYLDRIQRSFGSEHDVSSVSAYLGLEASAAGRRMGSLAFATGEQVVFGVPPSLRLAAHEAAHVIQQRRGVSSSSVGDVYEQHADAVAERVVAGGSAAALLDAAPGPSSRTGSSPIVQHAKPTKQVSAKAMVRLQRAKGAMELTKAILSHGAGNQTTALKSSKFNSFYRMKLARDEKLWTIKTPEVKALTQKHPNTYDAARAYVAQGGNCQEHALIAFEYLRASSTGDTLNLAGKRAMDHAFVIVGSLTQTLSSNANGDPLMVPDEPDSDLAVADPWPTAPTATLWEDHFCHTTRDAIEVSASVIANGSAPMMTIAAGIEPTAEGMKLLEKTDAEPVVDEKIANWEKNHYWNQANTAAAGKDYQYQTPAVGAPGRVVSL